MEQAVAVSASGGLDALKPSARQQKGEQSVGGRCNLFVVHF